MPSSQWDGSVRNQNIRENRLDESDIAHIKQEFANKYRAKALAEGDLIVTRTGYPGIACVVPRKYVGCQTFTTLIVRLHDQEKTLPIFVSHFINSQYGKEYVATNKVGVAQQNFGATALSGMPIVVPPLSLQRQFAAFVEKVEGLKATAKKELEQVDLLYRAKLQEYFG